VNLTHQGLLGLSKVMDKTEDYERGQDCSVKGGLVEVPIPFSLYQLDDLGTSFLID
jgi:hypothetical protein